MQIMEINMKIVPAIYMSKYSTDFRGQLKSCNSKVLLISLSFFPLMSVTSQDWIEYKAKTFQLKYFSEKAARKPQWARAKLMYDNSIIALMPQGFVFRVDFVSLKVGAFCKKPLKKIIYCEIYMK